MSVTAAEDQQFCLRWNNFQAYMTSQFEALRDDEDFVDVTLACEGQRLGAHKVVLSACSPFFKELFKANPCPHPIIFMRDVELPHVIALLEFMYAGEVNVAQAHLTGFLKTAESLQIRGLTDASKVNNKEHEDVEMGEADEVEAVPERRRAPRSSPSSSGAVTSTLDLPPANKLCKTEVESDRLHDLDEDDLMVVPKTEMPEYAEDGGGGGEEEEGGGSEDNATSQGVLLPPPPPTRMPHHTWQTCVYCGKRISSPSNLRKHVLRMHSALPSLRCALCRAPVRDKYALRDHARTQHGLRATTRAPKDASSSS